MPDYYQFVVPANEKIPPGPTGQDAYTFAAGFVTPSTSSRWTKDDGTRTITVHVPFALVADDMTLRSVLGQLAKGPFSPATERDILEKFGTAFYKKQVANQEVLTDARATLRGIVPRDPPDTSRVNLDQPPGNALEAMVRGPGPGVCLGRSHGESESLRALEEAIDSGAAGLLFVEEFLIDEQADLDAYLAPTNNNPDNFDFGVLKSRLGTLQSSHNVDWTGVLKKAKAQGMRIYGIDSGDGREYAGPLTAANGAAAQDSMGERRVSGMNKVTYDVMDAALRDPNNQGRKFLAVVGAKHSNTHEGGVVGVSQMFGCAAVRLDPDDRTKLKIDPEDRSLRGMPPLDEQLYVDYAMMDAARRNPQASPTELRKEALAQARVLRANGQLPTADEQKFIANYVEQAQKNDNLKDKDPEVLRNAALQQARAKTANGQLPTAGSISALVDAGSMATQISAVETLLRDINTAIEGNNVAGLKLLLTNNPNALTLRDAKGRSVLQLAVASKRQPIIAAVCERWPLAAAVDGPDENGDTALHHAVKGRPGNGPGKTSQAAIVQALIDGGADVNRGNRSGATPLHLVGKTDNEEAAEKLLDAGADVKKRDGRGWSALDAAIAGTSGTVEQMFYDQDKVEAEENYDNGTTIERLMKATLCEDPADRAKVQAAFEKLYMIPELRPVLELAALASSNKRAPGQGRDCAPRIVVAKGDNVKNLYEQPPGQAQQYPQGAFDEGASIVMVSNESANEFSGVLIHELTHMATQVMYGDEVEPFDQADGVAKQAYVDAIEADVKTMHLLKTENPLEARIKERISGRMLKYATDGRPADKGVLQEFIVGVPQLIAEFGKEAVQKFAPNLYNVFTDFAGKCRQEAANSPRFEDARDWLDDSVLHLAPTTFPPGPLPHEDVVKPDDASFQLDTLVETIKADYLIKHGNKQPPIGTVAFDGSSFTLDATAMKALDKKLAKVKDALKKSLANNLLTIPVAAEELRKLVQQMADLTHATAEKDLEKAATNESGKWLMSAKLDYVSKKAYSGQPMTDVEMAETIALNAEDQSGTGSSNFDYDVNLEKHASFVAKLTADLGNVSPQKKDDVAKQGAIIDAIVTKVTGSKTAGVYHKTAGRFSPKKHDPRHVSIDVKNARREWLKKLNAL